MTRETDAGETQLAAENLALLSQPLAGTWPRYWARMFDITLLSIVVAVALGLAAAAIYGPAIVEGPSYTVVATIILFPIVFSLDALIQFAFGNTLGKRLAGIRVETTALRKPTLHQGLMRNLWVWVRGIGLGIPLLNLAAMIACYIKVREGGLTSWDAKWDTRVINKHSNIYRTLLTFGCFLILAGAFAWLEWLGTKPAPSKQSVEQAIAAMNATLPRQLDEYTRMDRADYRERTVTYTYTMVDPQGAAISPLVTRATRSQKFKDVILKDYCNPEKYVAQKALGYQTRFVYRTVDGQDISEYVLSAASCQSGMP